MFSYNSRNKIENSNLLSRLRECNNNRNIVPYALRSVKKDKNEDIYLVIPFISLFSFLAGFYCCKLLK
jgi:hypothetical protein